MAKIHNYEKEREKRSAQIDYRDRIRRHRTGTLVKVLLILLAIGIACALVWVQYNNHIYTTYDVVASQERKAVNKTTEVRLGDTILTYSKDGAHCTDMRGTLLWNQTYQIQEVLLDICRNVAVIASYNGREIYVVSDEKQLGSFTTNLPIRSVAVAADGRVAVVMADTNVTYYSIYSAEGKHLYQGEATMSGSGYPAYISLSPDGELMQIMYMYLDAGVLESRVTFYNLGPVGANNMNYIVGSNEYQDTLIPYGEFMNDQTAFAVGDNKLIMYSGSQKPVPIQEHTLKEQVRSVFYNENYIGLTFYSESGVSLYRMNVYNTAGKLVGEYEIDVDYNEIIFVKDSFIAYNDAECLIMTLENEVKYRGAFEKGVRLLLPMRTPYRYLLVTGESLDTIQLR